MGTLDEDNKHGEATRPDDRRRIKEDDLHVACPYESNINKKKIKKQRKYQQLAFEMHKRREQYRVTVVPLVIRCLGGSIKKLTKDIKDLFKPEDVNSILSKMEKVVLWESETILKKVTSGLIQSVL